MVEVNMQVRGSSTPAEEQAYILRHSQSVGLVIQDAQALEKLLPHITKTEGALNGGGHYEPAGMADSNGSMTSVIFFNPRAVDLCNLCYPWFGC